MEKIKIRNLCKSFGDKVVLDNFSTDIHIGEINCLMAPSGAGKTTLIKILMGLETADSGEVSLVDKKQIRAVFQENRLIENLTAYTNIKIATTKSREEILKLMGELLLEKLEQSIVCAMSGGEKRRVSIARAILPDSDFVILDEPFKGLDEDTKSVVVKAVLNHTKGKTVLIITHSEEESRALSATNFISL